MLGVDQLLSLNATIGTKASKSFSSRSRTLDECGICAAAENGETSGLPEKVGSYLRSACADLVFDLHLTATTARICNEGLADSRRAKITLKESA